MPNNFSQLSFLQFPKPYAKDAAVGSLIIFITSNPAIYPAVLVAFFCLSMKYAGTVITTFLISRSRNFSALYFNFDNTFAEISSGENFLISSEEKFIFSSGEKFLILFEKTSICGLLLYSFTWKVNLDISSWTSLSLKLLAIILLIAYILFLGSFTFIYSFCSPTYISSSINETIDGVVLSPFSLGIISTVPFL